MKNLGRETETIALTEIQRELMIALVCRRIELESALTAHPDGTTRELIRTAALLCDVEDALERFRTGRYGICEECEEAIAPRRLQVVPWAVLCQDCQEKADLGLNRDESDSILPAA